MEKVREIRYEDQKENIRSELRELKEVNRVRPPGSVGEVLRNLLEAIEEEKKGKDKEKTQTQTQKPKITQ